MSGPKLWGGVFSKKPDDLAWKFGQSVQQDKNLLQEELDVSVAHAQMLTTCEILSKSDGAAIVGGLEAIRSELLDGRSHIPEDAEDLHGAIEWMLQSKIGDTAKRIHAGRSRNDQVVTVTRLWMKRRCVEIDAALAQTQETLLKLAEQHFDAAMPGYTHQQPAQPITLGFLLLAYFWMLDRDREHFYCVFKSADECPLGSAALSGTSLPIDRKLTAKLLGFSRTSPNALDAVSDRDFVGDALHACSTLMQHLSRLSQEIVLFSTAEFGYIRLDDGFSTGSSIMPQKRNPDIAELIRGRTGRAIGNWTGFMSMMKSLPLGYNRDQQEDKPPLYDSIALCIDSLHLCEGMLATTTFDTKRMAMMAGAGFSTATGVAESLVADGVPFRTAHELVGNIVKTCQAKGITLEELTEADYPADAPPALSCALKSASVTASIAARSSEGGPSPGALKTQIALAHSRLVAASTRSTQI